jgi:hypothetical protein
MSEIEYVNLPVPKHLVPAVMALIVKQMLSNGDASQQPDEPTPTTSEPMVLTEDLFKRIWKESGPTIRKAMTCLARRPGQAVSAAELAKEVFGSSKGHKLPGAMGAFGRRCKNHYDHVKPFSVEWNAVTSQWAYTMTADVAKWVGRASGGQ